MRASQALLCFHFRPGSDSQFPVPPCEVAHTSHISQKIFKQFLVSYISLTFGFTLSFVQCFYFVSIPRCCYFWAVHTCKIMLLIFYINLQSGTKLPEDTWTQNTQLSSPRPSLYLFFFRGGGGDVCVCVGTRVRARARRGREGGGRGLAFHTYKCSKYKFVLRLQTFVSTVVQMLLLF